MNNTFKRYFAFFMLLNILIEIVSPSIALALTHGDLQPEFRTFEPANSSEMVDLFTGDFKYNIPLMDVDGYPVNLAYHAGVNMETDASWVGLGWNINAGTLNRSVRGIPDDFKGDNISSKFKMKPYTNMGVGYQISKQKNISQSYEEILTGTGQGLGLNAGLMLTYNNYKGFGAELQGDVHGSFNVSIGGFGGNYAAGVGMSLSNTEGGIYNTWHSKGYTLFLYSANIGEGKTVNTRTGAVTKTFFGSKSIGAAGISVSKSISHSIPAGPVSYMPSMQYNYVGRTRSLSLRGGFYGCASLSALGIPITIKSSFIKGFNGYYGLNELASNVQNLPAFGYDNLEESNNLSLTDFNRFRDGAAFNETPNISYAQLTYDFYSATAQGFGANFRSHRSDVGIVSDNEVTTKCKATMKGGEQALGVISKTLIHGLTTTGKGVSKKWDSPINNYLTFTKKDLTISNNRSYQKSYFKQIGEIAGRDINWGNKLNNELLITPIMNAIPGPTGGYDVGYTLPGLPDVTKSEKDIRATNIQANTAAMAHHHGLDKDILLASNVFPTINVNTRMENLNGPVSRLTKGSSAYDIKHHYSEFNVRDDNGSRYTYGIPVYNLEKKRVSFNASDRKDSPYTAAGWPGTGYTDAPLSKSDKYQYVNYDPGNDLFNNLRGLDNVYREDNTPPYASSYLLTSITSVDYVDVTGNGLSIDDLGDYTKFNYFKDSDFGYREPMCVPAGNSGLASMEAGKNQANLDLGLFADKLDDKGSYEYGKRESYYLHTIETKNFIAYFELDPIKRNDNYDVSDEHGNLSTTSNSQKLKSIKLYSKSELLIHPTNPVPIKTVLFEYDYSLCPGVFNNPNPTSGGGKLTLKKVFFKYGNSDKASLSPYIFTYADNNHDNIPDANFTYNPLAVDRWGNYKRHVDMPFGHADSLNNVEYPYTEQQENRANLFASAWNLTKINTPSGSEIKITYEADDYGYVQNEQAGQMLMAKTLVPNINTSDDVNTYSTSNPIYTNNSNSNVLVVDLSKLNRGIPASLPFGQATNLIKQSVFKTGDDMYFKFFTKLAGPANSFGLTQDFWDYVSGYAKIQDAGVFDADVSSGKNTYVDPVTSIICYKYAFVRMESINAYNSKLLNPITVAAWQYLRLNLPRVAYPGSEPANMGDNSHLPLKQLTNILVGLGVAIADFVDSKKGDPNERFYKRKFCDKVNYNKSFVRAYVPYKIKKGGGHRVKSITTTDGWGEMTSNNEVGSIYGQEFNYKMIENGVVISSGVATYEPLQGNDENSMHKPIRYDILKAHAANDYMFQETPYCEMIYPAAQVGYSQVTVKNLSYNNVCPIGKTVFNFYTAKDFPVIEEKGALNKFQFQSPIVEKFSMIEDVYTILHASQGFLVKLNDMHGKLFKINTFGQNDTISPVSGSEFTYKSVPYNKGTRQLITTAKTIDANNTISDQQIARDIDLTLDHRENLNKSSTGGLDLNITLELCSPYFTFSTDVKVGSQTFGAKFASATKVVQQYGILEKVENFDYKSRTITENVLWDKLTGDVVLSKTTNFTEQEKYNVNKPMYSFNYPAYWIYKGMAHEFKRQDFKVKFTNVSSNPDWDLTTGIIKLSSVQETNLNLLEPGDEVVVQKSDGTYVGDKFWVTETFGFSPPTSLDNLVLVDEVGEILNTTTYTSLATSTNDYNIITVVRTRERNQLSESAGSISKIENPLTTPTTLQLDQKVIDANAQMFCDGWNAYSNSENVQSSSCFPTGNNYSLIDLDNDKYLNLYTMGLYGNYRPLTNLKFKGNRNYSGTQGNILADGAISSFNTPWIYNTTANKWESNFNNWVPFTFNDLVSPYGYVAQSLNPIGIYSATRKAFNHTLPSAVASNGKLAQIGFDSFEDYPIIYPSITTFNGCLLKGSDHLNFYSAIDLPGTTVITKPIVSNEQAHTGRYSLKFTTSQSFQLAHPSESPSVILPFYLTSNVVANNSNSPINQSSSFCRVNNVEPEVKLIDKLNFPVGKYIVSFWLKNSNPASLDNSPFFNFNVKFTSSTPPISTSIVSSLEKKSTIINGWQKFDYSFVMTGGPGTVQFEFTNTSTPAIYLDDFRVQPFNSTMECYVYDPYQLRLWAKLDDRNFASIIEYDNQGVQVRTKKETEKGIYTINEVRSSAPKK